MKKHYLTLIAAIIAAAIFCACSEDTTVANDDNGKQETPKDDDKNDNDDDNGDDSDGDTDDDGQDDTADEVPDQGVDEYSGGNGVAAQYDTTIRTYDGSLADDSDTAGTDEDLYWEANDFSAAVIDITYSGTEAKVESGNSAVIVHQNGAHVCIDLQSGEVKGAHIRLSGTSDDGSLKVYGAKKYMLTLNGVNLRSQTSPAINSQCKKRVFLHLADGTTNTLTDAASYGDDVWYSSGNSSATEDRKGCLFCEGNIILSGRGSLSVEGRQKHAVATDGYFRMRAGATLVITGATKNGLHVKGDVDDGIGVRIDGGLLYANVAGAASKCIKCDTDINITGGRLSLNTSGAAYYDTEDKDTSSSAGLKADGNIVISGGEISAVATGTGGKGINADGSVTVSGGTISIVTSGGKYTYGSLSSSPKGIKADGDIVFGGGSTSVYAVGRNDGAEGIESKSTITVNKGSVYSYSYDDAINAATDITVNGGSVFAYAVNNDGIDSNGTISVTGGRVIASGTSSPEEGFDCDNNRFAITGGILIGTGSTTSTPTASACTQRSVIYNGLSATAGKLIALLDADGTCIMTYELPRTMQSMCLLFSSPDLAAGSYTLMSGGTIYDTDTSWGGWFGGGTWAGGSSIASFDVNNTVTTVNNSGGGNTPGGGGGGGNFPGGGH